MQLLKLRRISLILLVFSVFLSGCALVNCHAYVNMYGDAIRLRNVETYTDYMIISPNTFNTKTNEQFLSILKAQTNISDILLNEKQTARIEKSVENFRSDSIKIFVGEVNESSNIAIIKIDVFNTYDLYVEEINRLAKNEKLYGDYNEAITSTIEYSYDNSIKIDRIEIEIEVSVDEVSGKYFIDEKNESLIFTKIMGM